MLLSPCRVARVALYTRAKPGVHAGEKTKQQRQGRRASSSARMGSQWPMILIPEAQRLVLQHTRTLPTERVPVAAALGRVLAQAVTAPDPLPPFPASIKVVPLPSNARRSTLLIPNGARDRSLWRAHGGAQDGYAVVASDGPGEYDVVGESRAGSIDDLPMRPGVVAYITTGARRTTGCAQAAPWGTACKGRVLLTHALPLPQQRRSLSACAAPERATRRRRGVNATVAPAQARPCPPALTPWYRWRTPRWWRAGRAAAWRACASSSRQSRRRTSVPSAPTSS